MTNPAPPDHRGQRSHAHEPVPDDVTDRMLWTNAADVAAAHRPGPDGTCTSLLCRGQQAPCDAARAAGRAAQLARTASPVDEPHPARGRATVPATPNEFAALAAEAATAPDRPAPQRTFAAFRRPDARAAPTPTTRRPTHELPT
jgi:hypothetical protein